jgi:hypothetical protein
MVSTSLTVGLAVAVLGAIFLLVTVILMFATSGLASGWRIVGWIALVVLILDIIAIIIMIVMSFKKTPSIDWQASKPILEFEESQLNNNN